MSEVILSEKRIKAFLSVLRLNGFTDEEIINISQAVGLNDAAKECNDNEIISMTFKRLTDGAFFTCRIANNALIETFQDNDQADKDDPERFH